MPGAARLSHYAWLTVACDPCRRRGRYSVARLAERYGAEITLPELLRRLTASCKWQRAPGAPLPRPYEPRCLAHVTDLVEPPPAAPALRVVRG